MEYGFKEIFGLIAILIAIISYVPYFAGIYKGAVKPHAFTWTIWGILTLIAFFAQWSDGGGAGAWVTGFTALVSFFIVLTAIRNGFKNITKTDWSSFAVAVLSIPLWIITKNPLWSVILITVIDALGFYPTIRKSYTNPYEEPAVTYGLSSIKFIFAIFALGNFSVITVLYPASLVLANGLFVVMLWWRRKGVTS